MKIHANPFKAGIPGHPQAQTIDAESRVRLVRDFSLDQCNLALLIPGLQKTVLAAVQRRVRQLKKAGKRC